MTRTGIRLFGAELTPPTEKVRRALQWKGLAFELVQPTSPDDYRRWNPETGLLPVLEIDGVRVPDSAAILDELDRRHPDRPLTSRDPRVAREQRRVEAWVGETFTFYMLRWQHVRRAGGEPATEPAPGGTGPLSRLGLLGPDGRPKAEMFDTRDGGPGPEFERRLDDLESMLAGRPYFLADRLSRADLAVFACLYSLWLDRYPGGRALLVRRPGLADHTARIDAQTGPPGGA